MLRSVRQATPEDRRQRQFNGWSLSVWLWFASLRGLSLPVAHVYAMDGEDDAHGLRPSIERSWDECRGAT